jgi:hypothetical protein
MAERRNYPEGCPLASSVFARLGKRCLAGCDGPITLDRMYVGTDDLEGPVDVKFGEARLCGASEPIDQLYDGEVVTFTGSWGELAIFDAESIASPRQIEINYGV